jgi:hypothetical protein
MRAAISGRSTIAPTAARPGVSLYATVAVRPKIKEVHVFNTTTSAFIAGLIRLTNATGVGAGLTEVAEDDLDATVTATGFAGHTSDPGLGTEVRRAAIGAAIGSGVIWTFGEQGLHIAAGTANGIGIYCPTGTGQVFDYAIVWDE